MAGKDINYNGLHKILTEIQTTLAVVVSQQERITSSVERNTDDISKLRIQQAVDTEKLGRVKKDAMANTGDIRANLIRILQLGVGAAILSKQLNIW